jgi:hypothetical protein
MQFMSNFNFSFETEVVGPKSLEVDPCNLSHWEHGSWDLPLHIGSQGLTLKYDMDAYIATFFGDEAWDIWWELGRTKPRSNSQHKSLALFLHKVIKIQDPTLMNLNHTLVLEVCKVYIASMLIKFSKNRSRLGMVYMHIQWQAKFGFQAGEGKILPVIPQLIVPIKAALNTRDPSVINITLMVYHFSIPPFSALLMDIGSMLSWRCALSK